MQPQNIETTHGPSPPMFPRSPPFGSTIPTTPSPGPVRASQISTVHRCPNIKCQYSKTTYKRQSDLKRHLLKQEGTALECSAVGCSRCGTKAFYRADKLKEHIRRAHGYEVQFSCPVRGCQYDHLPLMLLGLHMNSAHPTSQLLLAWWSLFNHPFCPLRPCRKALKDNAALIDHMRLKHTERERIAQTTAMTAASLDSISYEIICPVCAQRTGNLVDVFADFLVEHLLKRDHFQTWITALNEDRSRRQLGKVTYDLLMEGYPRINGTFRDSRRAMEVTSPELVSNRETALRSFPVLEWHSVFDDLRRLEHHLKP